MVEELQSLEENAESIAENLDDIEKDLEDIKYNLESIVDSVSRIERNAEIMAARLDPEYETPELTDIVDLEDDQYSWVDSDRSELPE